VTWVNRDPVEHDADAKDGTWDGPLLVEGESWPRTFEVSGDFLVTCSIHPYMQGLVKVR
jgi:plastocyanin